MNAVRSVLSQDNLGFVEQAEPSALSLTWPGHAKTWSNAIGQQTCTPAQWRYPDTLQSLVAAVKEARGKGKRVRAVGSGHAFSDVTRTDDAFLIDPKSLGKAQGSDPKRSIPSGAESFKPDADAKNLFRSQSGITIVDLNTRLENNKLALTNMGSYDGQTIAGAFSTGTHGSGARFGPIASSVVSIVLVTETGKVYQLEPSTDSVTDPAKFPGHVPEALDVAVELKQDDDWFNAVKVSMGCMGVIYSVTLRVQEAFSLSENRTLTTWEALKPLFAPENFKPLPEPLANNDHFEFLINPYVIPLGPTTHTAIQVARQRIKRTKPRGARASWLESLLKYFAVASAPILVWVLNRWPALSPEAIQQALGALVDQDPPYVDNSPKVFTLGVENRMKALALELHFDARDTVATIDAILAALADFAKDHLWYLPGPIGVRFIRSSDALIAPESGRLTCTAELDMLFGTKSAGQLLDAVKKRICDQSELTGDRSVRIHWGLDPLDGTTTGDVRKWYGSRLDRWQEVHAALNTTGMFDNKFSDRIGVSKK
ncbi:FAD-dependent oxidoreductase [Podospora appendiculata]|uniref:D-arabinono-1,4-lactone oxidase n=1 Tax=Podospora appendiculata TaxID=314037 RepID=A0AAE0X581_9PEZI|nr:FAD-dependent oxidoreductase [Podospora appendiculata]